MSKKNQAPVAPTPAPSVAAPAPKPAQALHVVGVCGLLLLAVWAVFGQTAWFDFVNLDDDQYVYESAETQKGFTPEGIAWAWTHSQVGNWHPLTTMSFMLDWSLFGNEAGGYHVHNVLLHSLATVLLFLLLYRMTGALWLSALATTLFALHPLRAESVAWVTERKDVLSNVFFMLALHAYVHYVARPSGLRYLVLLVVFALGLMSKAMLVTLPVVMLLLDYWPLARFAPPVNAWGEKKSETLAAWIRRTAWLVVEKVPLFLVAMGFAVATAVLSLSAERAVAVLPFIARLKMAPVSCVIYLGQMFYPVGLAAHYPYSNDGPPLWQVAAACTVLVVISACAGALWKKYPYFIVGWLWYLVTLLPVIGLVPGGNQMRADRYTGLTQIGLYAALCWAAADLTVRWPYRRAIGFTAAALLVCGMMVATYQQTGYWSNSETLWRHTLECTTANTIAHEHLAGALTKQAEKMADPAGANNLPQARQLLAEAKRQYQKALEFTPDSMIALCNMGTMLDEEGNGAAAAEYYRRAIKSNPKVAAIHYNLGVNLIRRGRADDAITSFGKALELNPQFAAVHNNLANIYREKGRLDKATMHYEAAIASEPKFTTAYNGLGAVLQQQGRFDEAAANFKQVLEVNPQDTSGLSNLGDMVREQGKLEEAAAYYQQAVTINPRDVVASNNLGDLFSRQEKFNEAIAVYEKAVEFAPNVAILRYNLGYCYEKKGRSVEAYAAYQKAWALAQANHDTAIEQLLRNRFGDPRFIGL